VRAQIAQYGGFEVKTIGDAFRHGARMEAEKGSKLLGRLGRGPEGGEDTELDRREENLGRSEAHADLEDALRCESHETSDTRASRPTTPVTLRTVILTRGGGEWVDWSNLPAPPGIA